MNTYLFFLWNRNAAIQLKVQSAFSKTVPSHFFGPTGAKRNRECEHYYSGHTHTARAQFSPKLPLTNVSQPGAIIAPGHNLVPRALQKGLSTLKGTTALGTSAFFGKYSLMHW